MEDNMKEEELTIDLGQLFQLLKKNLRLIVLSMVICAVAAFAITTFLLPKKYASESSIFIVSKVNQETGTVDANALSANSKQVNNYMELIKGKNILNKVAEQLNIEDVKEVQNAISVSNKSETEIIDIKATTDDPTKSQQIVKATTEIFFKEVKETLKIENMTVLNDPEVEETPVSPSKKMNTLIGALLGLLCSGGYVFLTYLLDKRLRTKQEAVNFLGIPVLAEIPYYEE